MDLTYLRSHPHQLPTLLEHQRIRETPVPGGSICTASRLTLDDGADLFVKTLPAAPEGFFAAEAAGLRWLAEPGGLRWLAEPGTVTAENPARLASVAVPEVIAALDTMLALQWVTPGAPTPAAAVRFGRELATLHRAGAPAFGAPWPGFIGRLPQDNTAAAGPWPPWFAEHRLAPHLRTSADRGALSSSDVAAVERIIARIDEYGGDEPPARIHGDMWPGNLLWADDRVWLVDPAAHGGHRETDLATLALFGGAPHLDRILAAYQEAWPLAPGWRERVRLHQLHLMLVHTALFGESWRSAVLARCS